MSHRLHVVGLLVIASLLLLPAQPPAVAQAVCAGAIPIAEARARPLDADVTVQGVVSVPTGVFTDRQSFALQDASGGIYVYAGRGIGQALAAGDVVCVSGRLAEHHGLREITPGHAAQVSKLGTAAAPTPQVVQPAQVGEATEGRLVQLTGPVSRLGERRFRVGGVLIYLTERLGLSGAGLQNGCPATVSGLSADYDGAQIWPRSQADIRPGACTIAVHPATTIARLQGPGPATPYDTETIFGRLTGCVTGVTADGFFLQDPTPDADPATSEGIFVFRYTSWQNPRGLTPGTLVELRDFRVQEFYDQTEIIGLSDDTDASYRTIGRCPLPDPIPVPPPGDPALDPAAAYERFEGMRVSVSFDGSVIGPTHRYASRYPARDPEIVLLDRSSPYYGRRVFAESVAPDRAALLPEGRGSLALSGGLGVDLPLAGALDRIAATDLTGVLAYQFGRYVLLVDDPARLQVTGRPAPTAALPAIGPDEFAICSFNVLDLFDAVDDGDGDMGDWAPADQAEFRVELAKRAAAIRQALQGCTIVGLQEVEGKDAVWAALAQAAGSRYRYDYYESADVRDITTGLLYDAGRVELRRSAPAQACTATDYGVDYATVRGPRATENPCAADAYPLFDRPPHVADLVVRNERGDRALEVRVVVNHLKSKRGDEAANAPRRVQQAAFVAGLLPAADAGAHAVALGDFNDLLASDTLAQFAGHVNLFARHIPPDDRYTYIYEGRAEALDHFVATAGLDARYLAGGPVHINADFPEKLTPDATSRRSSDHDPLFVRFAFGPTGVSDALLGAVAGAAGTSAGRPAPGAPRPPEHQSQRLRLK
ncbi:MAG: Endonuclease/Exonuclease/phosphatase family protein [Chloroflexi bacterium ADurb.Bin325]|nr:MAG: Endonuclease/Exonuclease/phosphatase family protein [Chloroflexi bacterium ADurb.Bin325]